MAEVRSFDTGATREADTAKVDIEGHLSPLALTAFTEYMNKHRILPDGSRRASDNWQKGIPNEVYVKSLLRHTFDVWNLERGWPAREPLEDALCGVIFNALGRLHELKKEQLRQIEKSGIKTTYIPNVGNGSTFTYAPETSGYTKVIKSE